MADFLLGTCTSWPVTLTPPAKIKVVVQWLGQMFKKANVQKSEGKFSIHTWVTWTSLEKHDSHQSSSGSTTNNFGIPLFPDGKHEWRLACDEEYFNLIRDRGNDFGLGSGRKGNLQQCRTSVLPCNNLIRRPPGALSSATKELARGGSRVKRASARRLNQGPVATWSVIAALPCPPPPPRPTLRPSFSRPRRLANTCGGWRPADGIYMWASL